MSVDLSKLTRLEAIDQLAVSLKGYTDEAVGSIDEKIEEKLQEKTEQSLHGLETKLTSDMDQKDTNVKSELQAQILEKVSESAEDLEAKIDAVKVPTKTSEIENDSQFQNAEQVSQTVQNAIDNIDIPIGGGSGNLNDLDGVLDISHGGTGNNTGYVQTGENAQAPCGNGATAEGYSARATGDYAHAEGYNNTASGVASHAEGGVDQNTGDTDLIYRTNTASGVGSHAEGANSTASGAASHAEGSAKAKARASHAEGSGTAEGAYSHAEGGGRAYGECSHAEGYYGSVRVKFGAYGAGSHVEGNMCSTGAEGSNGGAYAHAEGESTKATGRSAHAEGNQTTASGEYSHAEGLQTVAAGEGSHVEGHGSTNTGATGAFSHAEGTFSTASGAASHAEGSGSKSTGIYSHAEGLSTQSNNNASHAQGKYNRAMATGSVTNTAGDAMVIGNGTDVDALSNAFRVTFAGETYGLAEFNSTGADYAEYFEWADGNAESEDRVGYFVTIKDGKISKAKHGDYILGIVSGQPCIIGNADEDWLGRWEHDDFGRFIKEETSETDEETGEITKGWRYKANPNYDSTQAYIPRKERKEWDAVGMLGVLSVRDDGTCEVNKFCTVSDDGTATAAQNDSENRYFVKKRVSGRVVQVIFR